MNSKLEALALATKAFGETVVKNTPRIADFRGGDC